MKRSVTIIGILLLMGLATVNDVRGQALYLKFTTQSLMDLNTIKAVSGFDNGKEFVTAEDLGEAMLKLFSSDTFYLRGGINRNQCWIHSDYYHQDLTFNLTAPIFGDIFGDAYLFSGNGVYVSIAKTLNKVIIITDKVDKNGNTFLYLAIFGKP